MSHVSVTGAVEISCSCHLALENLFDPGITLSFLVSVGPVGRLSKTDFCSPMYESTINTLVKKDNPLVKVGLDFI